MSTDAGLTLIRKTQAGPRCNESIPSGNVDAGNVVAIPPGKVVGLHVDSDAYRLILTWMSPDIITPYGALTAYIVQLTCGPSTVPVSYNQSSDLHQSWIRFDWQTNDSPDGMQRASLSSMQPVDREEEADILLVSHEKEFLQFNGIYVKDADSELWKHTLQSNITLERKGVNFLAKDLDYERNVGVDFFRSNAPSLTCLHGEEVTVSVLAQSKCCEGEAAAETFKLLALPSPVLGLTSHEKESAIHLTWDQVF